MHKERGDMKKDTFISFVIITNEDLVRYRDHWAVVHENEDLNAVKACRQFERVVKEYPRDLYGADHIEPVRMEHVVTGEIYYGGIYRLSKKSAERVS